MRQLFVAPLAFFLPAAVRELLAFRRVGTESFRPRVRELTLQAIVGCEEIHCHGAISTTSHLACKLVRSLHSRCDCDHKKGVFCDWAALPVLWAKITFPE